MVEQVHRIATDKIDSWLTELFEVVAEIDTLSALRNELMTGPRNANDVYALSQLSDRRSQLIRERNALRKMIHEEPEVREK
jgi:hypothetical protein